MKIAAVQMVSTPDVDRNLQAASRLVAEAASKGAGLVVLPEYFCLMGRRDDDKLRVAEAAGDGPIQQTLSEAARRHGVWLVGGTLPLRSANAAQALNSCHVWAPDGSPAARYDKIHLFDVDLPSGESWRESSTYTGGHTAVVAPLPWAMLGLTICYDVRFPNLYRALALAGASVLSAPACFTRQTGEAHWHVLHRARAIETGSFMISAAQGGRHEDGRETYGHSLIVDPWGRVLAESGTEPGVILAEIDLAAVEAARTRIPTLRHGRDFSVAVVGARSLAAE